jgi:hypothetical protein
VNGQFYGPIHFPLGKYQWCQLRGESVRWSPGLLHFNSSHLLRIHLSYDKVDDDDDDDDDDAMKYYVRDFSIVFFYMQYSVLSKSLPFYFFITVNSCTMSVTFLFF